MPGIHDNDDELNYVNVYIIKIPRRRTSKVFRKLNSTTVAYKLLVFGHHSFITAVCVIFLIKFNQFFWGDISPAVVIPNMEK